jgi:hypothetical protein
MSVRRLEMTVEQTTSQVSNQQFFHGHLKALCPNRQSRSAEVLGRSALRYCFLGGLVLGSTLDQLSPKLR